MIHYQLRCDAGHEFEGWFRNSESFDTQAASGLLTCPRCGITQVRRGLMAPAVRTKRAAAQPDKVAAAAKTGAGAQPPAGLPDEVRAVLQRLRSEIERHCDDLGDRFADEAIRMSRGEIAVRGIYGNATDEDREALADEGIEIMQLPWLKPAES